MKKYILALDEGTTSTRAILFDRAGEIVSTAQREFPSQYPQPGWVEQDAQEIYAAQYATLTESLVRCGAEMQEVAAIGITNQRETVVVWERHRCSIGVKSSKIMVIVLVSFLEAEKTPIS